MTDIAVVIPCYNLGSFVEEALESVLAQSRPAADIVIVDDGSTDISTRQVLATIQAPSTRVVRTVNGGAAAARNHGIRLTTAPYLVTLDADDMLERTYLEATAQCLDIKPQLGFVSTAYQTFGDASYVWTPPACDLITALTQGSAHVASMFRRPLWEAVGGFDEAFSTAEDLDFWISAMELGFEGEVLDQPLLRCRVRKDSKHHRHVAQGGYATTMAAILGKHRRAIERLGPELLLAKESFLLAQRAHQRHLETSTAIFVASAPTDRASPGYDGYHDVADCDTISGWVWDGSQPDTPIKVDIYDGDVPFATLTANVFRQDLLDAGKGDGRHGFYCTVPFWLKDGKPHCIRVKVAGTDVELIGTGKTINCELPILSEIRSARTTFQRSPRAVHAGPSPRPLAVFAPYIGGLSETFIRRHMEQLLPDGTVVITDTAGGPYGGHWNVNCPVLVLEGRQPGERAGQAELFLRRHKVQVLLGEYLNESLSWLPVARQATVRFFAHAHGYDVSQMLRDPKWRAEYQKYDEADGIITMSQVSRSRLVELGLNGTKIHVIPYGVDVPDEPVKRPGRDVVRCVAVGRMVAKKAPILTLAAFWRAAQIRPDLRLDYVGGGELLPAARQFIRAFDLEKQVTLHGPQPKDVVDRVLDQGDIFLQHSITDPETGDEEGLPVAVLEAMAHGLPVLSTRHAGIPEAVLDGDTGYLVEEGDDVGMAEQLLSLTRDSELRHRLGQAGWRRAKESFSWERERTALLAVLGLRESSRP